MPSSYSTYSLVRDWIWSQGFSKSRGEKVAPRISSRESYSLVSSWMVDDGLSKLWTPNHKNVSRSSAGLASSWLIQSGILRVDKNVDETRRVGVGRAGVAYSWLIRSGISRIIPVPKTRLTFPALTAATAAGLLAFIASKSSFRSSSMIEDQRTASSALVRHNSTGAVTYLLRKVA